MRGVIREEGLLDERGYQMRGVHQFERTDGPHHRPNGASVGTPLEVEEADGAADGDLTSAWAGVMSYPLGFFFGVLYRCDVSN